MLSEKFTTRQSECKYDVDIYFEKNYVAKQLGINEEQVESTSVGDLNVVWEFFIEMRSWGVKSVGAYACDVYSHLEDQNKMIEMYVEYYETNDDDAELIDTTINIDVSQFEVMSSVENVEDRSMYSPQHVEFDLVSKEITVSF